MPGSNLVVIAQPYNNANYNVEIFTNTMTTTSLQYIVWSGTQMQTNNTLLGMHIAWPAVTNSTYTNGIGWMVYDYALSTYMYWSANPGSLPWADLITTNSAYYNSVHGAPTWKTNWGGTVLYAGTDALTNGNNNSVLKQYNWGNNTNFSILFWVYPTNMQGYRSYVSCEITTDGASAPGWSICNDPAAALGGTKLGLSYDQGGTYAVKTSGNIPSNAWTLVALVRSSNATNGMYFVTNTVKNALYSGNVTIDGSATFLTIGRWYENVDNYYSQAYLGELQIYNRDLSMLEITNFWNATCTNKGLTAK
jgi:hypothetical protein